jgi:large subunit ribosomal protein L15
MGGELNLSNLSPAQARKDRKRIGRGLGSGKGRYSGRGIKGQKSRAGSHAMRAGFEGGQMPLVMRTPKLRGNTSKDAMPVGPFRTYTQPVNIRDLDRFDDGAEVTPEALKAKGLIRTLRKDVKLLGVGELTKKLTITVHAASATAREKVEGAGGTLTLLKEPKPKRPPRVKRRPGSKEQTTGEEAEADQPVEPEATASEEPEAEDSDSESDSESEA